MSEDEFRLRRLFNMARRAPKPDPESIPDHLKTRILTHWRSGAAQAEAVVLLISWMFKRALVAAAVVTVFCALWSYDGLMSSSDDEIAIANYQLREDVMP